MQQQDQGFAAALEQWKPLIEKFSFKAAQRAAAMKAPISADDFRQILRITLHACLKSYDPNRGVKLITFLYNAFWNEINKEFRKIERETEIPEIRDPKTGALLRPISHFTTISGDGFGGESSGDDRVHNAWDHMEDEVYRSAENQYMDRELRDFVAGNLKGPAKAVFGALVTNNHLVGAQLHAYNKGIELEAQEGGMRRLALDFNLPFVCRLMGINRAQTEKIGSEIRNQIAAYGAS